MNDYETLFSRARFPICSADSSDRPDECLFIDGFTLAAPEHADCIPVWLCLTNSNDESPHDCRPRRSPLCRTRIRGICNTARDEIERNAGQDFRIAAQRRTLPGYSRPTRPGPPHEENQSLLHRLPQDRHDQP